MNAHGLRMLSIGLRSLCTFMLIPDQWVSGTHIPIQHSEAPDENGIPLTTGQFPISDLVITNSLVGGLSGNKNFLCTWRGKRCVLRQINPVNSKEEREGEIQAALLASDLGIGPSIYAYDAVKGWLLMAFVKGSTLGQVESTQIPDLVATIRKLHTHKGNFPKGERMIWKIHRLISEALADSCPLPTTACQKAIRLLKDAEEQFQYCPLVPCHGDLNAQNILIGEKGYFIIDWTEAGLDDPLVDLAYFALTHQIPQEKWQLLLALYYDRAPTSQEGENFSKLYAIGALHIFASLYPAYVQLQPKEEFDNDRDKYSLERTPSQMGYLIGLHRKGELSDPKQIVELALCGLHFFIEYYPDSVACS